MPISTFLRRGWKSCGGYLKKEKPHASRSFSTAARSGDAGLSGGSPTWKVWTWSDSLSVGITARFARFLRYGSNAAFPSFFLLLFFFFFPPSWSTTPCCWFGQEHITVFFAAYSRSCRGYTPPHKPSWRYYSSFERGVDGGCLILRHNPLLYCSDAIRTPFASTSLWNRGSSSNTSTSPSCGKSETAAGSPTMNAQTQTAASKGILDLGNLDQKQRAIH